MTSTARDSCLRLNWRAKGRRRRSESDSERLRSLAAMDGAIGFFVSELF